MRWTGRFFLRNKALCALFAGMVIIPSGATVYFGILKMSGFELLYNLVRIQYIIDLVWVSMTAFFMSRAEANDLRDCIDVSTGKCFFYEREALKWILLLWGVWNIIAIVTLLIGSYRNDAIFALSANWFLRGYLMNIALPQLICILSAAAFVRASHKIAAGFLLILFLFLISPFREQIVWTKAEVPVIVQAWNASKQKRQELVKQFNSDTTPVFLISLKAGGVGLNLTGADVVIHYDPWWNQAVQNQATDRAHRIGQTKKVTVYKLIARNTIEEKIQKLQEAKQDLAEQIISGDMGQLSGMSREDILELL